MDLLLMARPRLAAAFVAMGLTLAAVPAFADARSDSKAQVDFGIKAAQRDLWKEALYRWKRAVEVDPTYAAAFNNLAIAYEHNGQFDDARDEGPIGCGRSHQEPPDADASGTTPPS